MSNVTNIEASEITAINNAQDGFAVGDCSGVRLENAVLNDNAVGAMIRALATPR